MEETKIELGKKYRDKVTDFEGVAIGQTNWLTGCATAGLQGKINKEGKKPEAEWFDVNRLEPVESKAVDIDTGTDKGGPHDTPPEQHC